jgi:hypothetical protein
MATKRHFLTILLSLFAIGVSCRAYPAQELSDEETFQIGVETYIFGYPLVLMNETKQVMTHTNLLFSGPFAPVNQLAHTKEFLTPSFDTIVSPNVDTLYTSGWLDLTNGPMVLHLPDTQDRYYVFEMLDVWTNVFSSIGKRTTGTKAGDFVITGPNWKGVLPQGAQEIKSPTNTVWIIGRFFCQGSHEYKIVNELQSKCSLLTLEEFTKKNAVALKTALDMKDLRASPKLEVDTMNAEVFFQTFAKLLQSNPPAPADKNMMEIMSRIDISPGKEFKMKKLDSSMQDELTLSLKAAREKINEKVKSLGKVINGWEINLKSIGNYGTDYLLRAAVAQMGLGVNQPEDAIYYYAEVDDAGKPLRGDHLYIIHFEKGQTPPVNAFWSVTMYNEQHYLVKNSIDRYAIHFYDNLQFNPDGTLDIYVQYHEPKEMRSNWLPAPKENFNLMLRLYWPKAEALNGTWKPPTVSHAKH